MTDDFAETAGSLFDGQGGVDGMAQLQSLFSNFGLLLFIPAPRHSGGGNHLL